MTNRSVLEWPHGVSVYRPDKCYNGFTLVHGRGNWDPTHGHRVQNVERWHLIDMSGRVVHKWTANPIRRKGSALFERLANGNYIINPLPPSSGDTRSIEKDTVRSAISRVRPFQGADAYCANACSDALAAHCEAARALACWESCHQRMTVIHKDLDHVSLNEDANGDCPSGGNIRFEFTSDFTSGVEDANPGMLYDNFSQRGNPDAH